jgi:hypothetical protein
VACVRGEDRLGGGGWAADGVNEARSYSCACTGSPVTDQPGQFHPGSDLLGFARHIQATLVTLNWRRTVVIERGVWESRSAAWKPHGNNVRNLRTLHSNEPGIVGGANWSGRPGALQPSVQRAIPAGTNRAFSVVWVCSCYISAESCLEIVVPAVSGSGIVPFLDAAGGSVVHDHEPSERRRSPCEQVQRHAARAE